MLAIEIAKPMQLTKVSTLPTASRGAFCAVSVENCGESPTTVTPQMASHSANTGSGAVSSRGASAQHSPLTPSCNAATRALPQRRTASPPIAQPTKPAAITANAAAGTSPAASRVARIAGTSTQNVYSSHMWPK